MSTIYIGETVNMSTIYIGGPVKKSTIYIGGPVKMSTIYIGGPVKMQTIISLFFSGDRMTYFFFTDHTSTVAYTVKKHVAPFLHREGCEIIT